MVLLSRAVRIISVGVGGLGLLSGCGGGGGSGGDGSAAPRAYPIDYIQVIESNVLAPTKFAVTAQDYNTTNVNLGTDEFEYANVTAGPDPWSDTVRVEVLVSKRNESKFALRVSAHPDAQTFQAWGCFSGSWTEDELTFARYRYIGYFTETCGNVKFKPHRLQLSNFTFRDSAQPANQIKLSVDFSWPANNFIYAPIKVLSGSTSVAPGDYWVDDQRRGERNQTFRGLTMDRNNLETGSQLALYLYYRADDKRKFIIDMEDKARPGMRYRCTSAAWTQSELATINSTPDEHDTVPRAIPPCPTGVVYDPASKLLTLNNVQLHEQSDPSAVLNVSYHATWHDLW
jgi:hypothetical protein